MFFFLSFGNILSLILERKTKIPGCLFMLSLRELR